MAAGYDEKEKRCLLDLFEDVLSCSSMSRDISTISESDTRVASHSQQTQKRRKRDDEPLSQDDISFFKRNGYILLKKAFSKTSAAEVVDRIWERMAEDGIRRDDPNSWCERKGIAETYSPSLGSPWSNVYTKRLTRAFDQLLGEDRWEKSSLGLGWWVVTFPGFGDGPFYGNQRSDSSLMHHRDTASSGVDHVDDWSAAGRWHVDGAHFTHFLNSQEVGLLPIFLFTDIGAQDGGTLLCRGSHTVVAEILNERREGLPGSQLSGIAKQRCSVVDYGRVALNPNIVEVNGEAGDVMLCHPFMLHARSQNRGKYLQRSVRPMCHPAISLKAPLRILDNQGNVVASKDREMVRSAESGASSCAESGSTTEATHLSPVECSILNAIYTIEIEI